MNLVRRVNVDVRESIKVWKKRVQFYNGYYCFGGYIKHQASIFPTNLLMLMYEKNMLMPSGQNHTMSFGHVSLRYQTKIQPSPSKLNLQKQLGSHPIGSLPSNSWISINPRLFGSWTWSKHPL